MQLYDSVSNVAWDSIKNKPAEKFNVIAPLDVDTDPVCLGIGNLVVGDRTNVKDSRAFYNIVIGDGASHQNSGSSNIVIGSSATTSSNNYSIAIGRASWSSGLSSISIGSSSYSIKDNSIAIGTDTKATQPNSIAIGSGSQADQENIVSVGTTTDTRRICYVTDPTDPYDVATKNYVDSKQFLTIATCTVTLTTATVSGSTTASKTVTNGTGSGGTNNLVLLGYLNTNTFYVCRIFGNIIINIAADSMYQSILNIDSVKLLEGTTNSNVNITPMCVSNTLADYVITVSSGNTKTGTNLFRSKGTSNIVTSTGNISSVSSVKFTFI